jgi:bile acid-coenzyme A ligase
MCDRPCPATDSCARRVTPDGEFVAATIAVWKLGATPLSVSWRLPDAELYGVLQVAEPALVVGVAAERAPDHRSVPVGFVPDPALSDEPLSPPGTAAP